MKLFMIFLLLLSSPIFAAGPQNTTLVSQIKSVLDTITDSKTKEPYTVAWAILKRLQLFTLDDIRRLAPEPRHHADLRNLARYCTQIGWTEVAGCILESLLDANLPEQENEDIIQALVTLAGAPS